MANATAVLTVTDTWSDGKRQFVIGTVAVDASPAVYVSGGIAFSLKDPKIKSDRAPVYVHFKSISVEYSYRYVASTKLLKILDQDQTSGVIADLAASSIPAGVSSDVIDVMLIFKQLI